MIKKRHARLRLVTLNGETISGGYKSRRKRCRDTPVAASTASTCLDGTPRTNQLDTVLCRPNFKARAKAVCPPTTRHASLSASSDSSTKSLLMQHINAQTVDYVNARTVNGRPENVGMGKTAVFAPSAFWRRLAEALGEKWQPMNPNSLAKRLGMSQGSVHRWYRGVGLPELQTALELSKEGGVCVDWLLNGVKPKYPISKDPVIRELFEICEELGEEGRLAVLRAAKGERLQQMAEETSQAQIRPKRA